MGEREAGLVGSVPPDTQLAPDPGPPDPPLAKRHGRLRSAALKLSLLAVSGVLCLGVVEVVFRLLGYQPLYSTYSKPELFWQRDPQLGWSLAPNRVGRFVGPRPFPIQFRTTVRTNSLGLRGADPGPVAPGARRVLVLGDSITAGFEVEEDQTYAALLGPALAAAAPQAPPVQVVNAGVRGYGTDQEYQLYEQRLRPLHPDVVVLHMTVNDPEDNTTLHRIRRPYGKGAFVLDRDGSLKPVGLPVPTYPRCSAYRIDTGFHVRRIDSARSRLFCFVESRLSDHSAFFTFLTSRIERNPALLKRLYGLGSTGEETTPVPAHQSTSTVAPAPPPSATAGPGSTSPAPAPAAPAAPTLDYTHALTSALVVALAKAVEADGAHLVVIGQLPDLVGLDLPALAGHGAAVIPLDGALGPDPAAVRVRNDGHFNQVGHRRIADYLAARLAPLVAR